MLLNIIILFVSAMVSGLLVFLIPKPDTKKFKVILSFSGSYLFAITVIHVLPEQLYHAKDITAIGIGVLCGFFLQMVLEFFSSGVEHGHIHVHEEDKAVVPYSLLVSLCIHSFLEGTVLGNPSPIHHHHEEVQPMLFGILLHKIPESFALMSVLVFRLGRKSTALILLAIFSAASPAGVFMSNFLFNRTNLPENIFSMLFAVVAGNFLYISTTIFFENSPNHQFKANKLLISLLGALAAIIAEYFI